jgi:hypothetical protein
MRSVVAALLLVAVTSSGAAASTEAHSARCTAARPIVSSTETAVEARVLTGCSAGELVVFRALMTLRAHGTSCTAIAEELEADPATEPQWIRTRLELECAPGEQGLLGSRITVEMRDDQTGRVTGYELGDSYAERDPAARHRWAVEFIAGMGDLPAAPDPVVKAAGGSMGQGSSRTTSDHRVHAG